MFLNTPGVEGTYGVFFSYDEMNSLATFYIGRLENGKIVCPYSFDCDYGENTYEDNAKPTLLKNEYGAYSLISTKQSMSDFRPSPTSEDSYPVTDIRKKSQKVGNALFCDFFWRFKKKLYLCNALGENGRLAQLVQSVCLTSRGSGVRIPQRPLSITYVLVGAAKTAQPAEKAAGNSSPISGA